jgi:hypothetical protein
MHSNAVRRTLVIALCLLAFDASAKPDDLEAKVKNLKTGKDVDALFKHLDVQQGCAGCKKVVATKWLLANVDTKVLAITSTDEAKPCATWTLDVIVLQPVGNVLQQRGHIRQKVTGSSPLADVSSVAVHDAAVKDLVIHTDGECSGTRENILQVWSYEHSKLEELLKVDGFTTQKIVGPPPATIQVDKAKLLFDPLAYSYDALPQYDVTIKSTVSKDTDETLSMKECAAGVGTSLVSECGLSGSAKVQVAVQHGKAIGLTVSSTPPKPAFVRCMRKKLGEATWKDVPGATGCTRTFSSG